MTLQRAMRIVVSLVLIAFIVVVGFSGYMLAIFMSVSEPILAAIAFIVTTVVIAAGLKTITRLPG